MASTRALGRLGAALRRIRDDLTDINALLERIPRSELRRARGALALIERRGYHGKKALQKLFAKLLRQRGLPTRPRRASS